MPVKRIASLLPSATEIVCALGCGVQLVARSHECDYPALAREAPICTRPRINPAASGTEIDKAVKDAAANGLPLFEIDTDLLIRARPDLILTQAQCEVCAVSETEIRSLVASWDPPRPEVLTLNATRFAHLWDDMRRVATAIGLPDDGKAAISDLKHRCVSAIEKAAVSPGNPSVLALEWMDPLMAGGNWIPDMIEMLGGNSLIAKAGEHSDWITLDEIAAANPDVIVLLPCGFNLSRTIAEAAALEKLPGWNQLDAVKNKRVFATDGSSFFNRPGPRLVDSLEILGEIFYPGMIEFGHESAHWQSLY
jgi:iron complex transport system substrate-binding protein